MAEKRRATTRKRSACGELRTLAAQLGVEDERIGLDMRGEVFHDVAASLQGRCATPEQRRQLEDVIKHFDGVVPPLPQGQANDAQEGPGQAGVGEAEVQAEGAGVADERVARSKPFRLRSRGCLFTYNSLAFRPDMWEDFVSWLNTLEFLGRWTATMEESLRSEDRRFHLHVFMEFVDSVDWTSLRSVGFMNVLPHASPCQARGSNLREALNRGHFYAFANKIGTVRVETSGYAPWADYGVKGWWIDNLWTEHKLSHKVYLEYALLGGQTNFLKYMLCQTTPFEATRGLQC